MSDFIPVQVKASNAAGFFDVLIRFTDGKKEHGGQMLDHDRMYGFSVAAKDEREAVSTLHAHMIAMTDALNEY